MLDDFFAVPAMTQLQEDGGGPHAILNFT